MGNEATTNDVLHDLQRLESIQAEHAFWDNPLFAACQAGSLTLDDFRYIFSQYSAYSKSFTRFLAALMANCDDDLFRARITENLWEESGGIEIAKRHAEIFRGFLKD